MRVIRGMSAFYFRGTTVADTFKPQNVVQCSRVPCIISAIRAISGSGCFDGEMAIERARVSQGSTRATRGGETQITSRLD
jgi:hypothetical protein